MTLEDGILMEGRIEELSKNACMCRGGQDQATCKTLPDYLKEGLTVLFVGVNPGLMSAKNGHYYSNPKNQFWKILYYAGLTDTMLKPEEDSRILCYGYGLTDLVKRPTRSVKEVRRCEYRAGAESLRDKVRRYKPRVVCFNGKTAFKKFAGEDGEVLFGWQEREIDGSKVFVAPSTSPFRMKLKEKVWWYCQLKYL